MTATPASTPPDESPSSPSSFPTTEAAEAAASAPPESAESTAEPRGARALGRVRLTLALTFALPGALPGALWRRLRGAVRGSIGRRLAAGFGCTLVLLVMVVAVGFVALGSLTQAADRVARGTADQVAAADEVRAASAGVLAAQGQYLIDDGASHADYDSAAQHLDQALKRLERLADTPVTLALVGRIQTGYQTFADLDAMIWEAVQADNQVKARNLSLGPERLAYAHLTSDAVSYTQYAKSREQAATTHLHQVAARARAVMVGIGLLAVAVGGWAASVITNSVRRPMAALEAASSQAAAGDLTARVMLTQSDEAGRLASVFNQMVARLEDFVADADFDAQLRRALEYVDTEPEVLDVIIEAATKTAPGRPLELLLADSSQAHLEKVAVAGPDPAGPACPVELPFSCPAVRNGRPTIYPHSHDLGACPKLKNRPNGPLSAACVPVTFMGRALGVVHLTAPPDQPPTAALLHRLTGIATEVGNRIGTVRAFERTHVQATTDSLTGLLNRRALEAAVRELHRFQHAYAVILADLDHFKNLNDTHGHETGDRALRLFARTLQTVTRPGDIISRYGGEEFLIVLPGCTHEHAAALAERLRTTLATALTEATVPTFTVSAGIADTTMADDLPALLRLADQALYQAKNTGRDRARIASPTSPLPTPGLTDGPTTATDPGACRGADDSAGAAIPVQGDPGMFVTMREPDPNH